MSSLFPNLVLEGYEGLGIGRDLSEEHVVLFVVDYILDVGLSAGNIVDVNIHTWLVGIPFLNIYVLDGFTNDGPKVLGSRMRVDPLSVKDFRGINVPCCVVCVSSVEMLVVV